LPKVAGGPASICVKSAGWRIGERVIPSNNLYDFHLIQWNAGADSHHRSRVIVVNHITVSKVGSDFLGPLVGVSAVEIHNSLGDQTPVSLAFEVFHTIFPSRR
jgi:hypothetical protein